MKRYAGPYDGQQYVGLDPHRRRSVVVRMTDAGQLLEAVQITNSPLALAEVMTRACPAVDPFHAQRFSMRQEIGTQGNIRRCRSQPRLHTTRLVTLSDPDGVASCRRTERRRSTSQCRSPLALDLLVDRPVRWCQGRRGSG